LAAEFAHMPVAWQSELLVRLWICSPDAPALVRATGDDGDDSADDRLWLYARYRAAWSCSDCELTLGECRWLASMLAWYWNWDDNMRSDPQHLACNSLATAQAFAKYALRRGHPVATIRSDVQFSAPPLPRTCHTSAPPMDIRQAKDRRARGHCALHCVLQRVGLFTPLALQCRSPLLLTMRRATPRASQTSSSADHLPERQMVVDAVQREIETRGVHRVTQVSRVDPATGMSLFELVVARIVYADFGALGANRKMLSLRQKRCTIG
jgi:hypothetical protein